MILTETQQDIVDYVDKNIGCKVLEVVMVFAHNTSNIIEEIENLIDKGQLVEVEYVTRMMDYRIKSLLFPMGSTINVRNNTPR